MLNKTILDIGAYNGIDGLALAVKNPGFHVYAFEANPILVEQINLNKKKIEKRTGKIIENYKIFNKAVSNKDIIGDFLIAKNPTCSSLNEFSDNIDEIWPGYKQKHCTTIEKIKIPIITLEKFCLESNIELINYLHVDTQGSDLDVLKGLGKFTQYVKRGVMEASSSEEKSLYKNSHTINDVKDFFKKTNFIIKKIEPVDGIGNEVNIYFENSKFSNFSDVKTKYNPRYYYRVIDNKTYLKDDIKDFFLRIFN